MSTPSIPDRDGLLVPGPEQLRTAEDAVSRYLAGDIAARALGVIAG